QLDRFLGKNDEAIQEYQNALKWNPDCADCWGGLSDIFSSAGNYTAVETITLAFMQTHADFVPGLRTLARNVYLPSGRLSEAIDTQSQVVSLAIQDPNVWDDYRVLAVMLAQAGRFPEALQAAQTGLTKAPQDKQTEMQNLITQLQQQLGVGPTLTNTVPGLNPTPTP
ncbi:MAG TPA: tetratricopeptide repeat protein, partial [Anaerolineae bacterium]|nr:tetratricopeptide repeat protein [Anaerolineae bacterium]